MLHLTMDEWTYGRMIKELKAGAIYRVHGYKMCGVVLSTGYFQGQERDTDIVRPSTYIR